jgi:hypothetical protein
MPSSTICGIKASKVSAWTKEIRDVTAQHARVRLVRMSDPIMVRVPEPLTVV